MLGLFQIHLEVVGLGAGRGRGRLGRRRARERAGQKIFQRLVHPCLGFR